MPIPTIPERDSHGQTERDRALSKSEFMVDANNHRELGEAIAAFWRVTDGQDFIGTAECKLEGTIRMLTVVLCCDEEQRVTCSVCHLVPARPTSENPAICTMCGHRVCSICWKRHEQGHWRPPVKTIGGEVIPF